MEHLARLVHNLEATPKSSTMAEQVRRSNRVGLKKVTTSSAYIKVRCHNPHAARAESKPSLAALSIIR
jgi:hypothetical protein